MNINQTIKPIGVPSLGVTSGIGYITIPIDETIDRQQFINDCYRTHKVTILGGYNAGIFYDVAIDKNVIKEIKFPEHAGDKGSAVVWINIPIFEKIVIIAILKDEDDYDYNEENSLIIHRESENNSITSQILSQTGQVNFSMTSQNNDNSVDVNIVNNLNTSKLNVYVKGGVNIHASEKINIQTDKELILNVKNSKSEDKVIIKYLAESGFSYIDEFNNEINCKDKLVEVKSEQINHNKGSEPMVLGNTLVDILSDLIDEINNIVVPTNVGPSGNPLNKINFERIKNKLDTIKSKISNLD